MVQLRRTPIDLPLDVAQGFVRDMQAYFAESNASKRDTIAARQLYAPRKYQRQSEAPIRIFDVKEMFHQMKDHRGNDDL
jgi:hypothetical protein